jgi:hypothetical protein
MKRMYVPVLLALLLAPDVAGREPPTSQAWAIQSPAFYEPAETCCFDLDGDGTVDDAFGQLLVLLSEFGTDWQAQIDAAIVSGNALVLLRWETLPPALADGPVSMVTADGVFEGTVPSVPERQAGLGSARWIPDSAGQPAAGALSGGMLVAAGGTLALPGLVPGGADIEVELEIIQLTAELALDQPTCSGVCSIDEVFAGSPALRGGVRVGAVLHGNRYFAAQDAIYRQCSCAGIDPGQPVIEYGENLVDMRYDASCTDNTGDPSACTAPGEETCATIATVCGTIGITPLLFDLDRNDNGIMDAFSMGLRLAVSGIDLVGDTVTVFFDGFEPIP